MLNSESALLSGRRAQNCPARAYERWPGRLLYGEYRAINTVFSA